MARLLADVAVMGDSLSPNLDYGVRGLLCGGTGPILRPFFFFFFAVKDVLRVSIHLFKLLRMDAVVRSETY